MVLEEIEGTVFQVLSGDSLILLLNDKTPKFLGSQRRVCLSSIRAPKLGSAKKGVADEPNAEEARMALVKLAIGKKVRLTVDYTREVNTGFEETKYTFCSMWLEDKNVNVNEAMVAQCVWVACVTTRGWCAVVRHKQDEPRAANYDQLLLAEEKAKAEKKGVYGKKSSSVLRRVDYSETPNKAQTNLHFLKEKKRYDVRQMAGNHG